MKQRIFWLAPDRFDIKPDKSSWLEMARCLRAIGWPVEILTACADKRQAQTYDGLVTYVPSLNLPFVFRLTAMWGCLLYVWRHSSRGDIVIFNEESLWLVPFLRLMGKRHLHLDIRTFPVSVLGAKQWVNHRLFFWLPIRLFGRRLNSYSFITERLFDMFVEAFGFSPKPRAIWQSGVNLEAFDVSGLAAADERYTVFYHGSLYLSRGIPNVIEAMAPFKDREDLRLVVVGIGDELPHLKNIADEFGVGHLVEFRGFVPYEDVPQHIAEADICICPLPDRPEWQMSSPLKVLEYMACEKPMILTSIDAHRDMVEDAPFVLWTDGAEAADFSQAIERGQAERTQLHSAAASARDYVKGRYEWRDQADKLHALLDSVL